MKTVELDAITVSGEYWCGHFAGVAFCRGFSGEACAVPTFNGVTVTFDEERVSEEAVRGAVADTCFAVSP